MRWIYFFFAAATTLLLGCAAPSRAIIPPGRPEDEGTRRLYIAKCMKCHGFYNPAAYPENEWRLWMSKMSKKAKLSPEESDTLARYLESTFRTNPAADSRQRN